MQNLSVKVVNVGLRLILIKGCRKIRNLCVLTVTNGFRLYHAAVDKFILFILCQFCVMNPQNALNELLNIVNPVGIDIVESQINNAREYFSDHPNFKNLELIASDIYDIQRSDFQFDVVILRDVIEHIHNQERFMDFVKRFMTANGVIFFGFPPWHNPFGGHQQICASRLSKVPYLHLLPYSLYRWVLRKCGETEGKIEALVEIKDTGITIERFERIVRRNGFKMLERQLFLINPNYEIKFGLKPRRAWPIFRSLPYLRNFYTTAGYYLLCIKPIN